MKINFSKLSIITITLFIYGCTSSPHSMTDKQLCLEGGKHAATLQLNNKPFVADKDPYVKEATVRITNNTMTISPADCQISAEQGRTLAYKEKNEADAKTSEGSAWDSTWKWVAVGGTVILVGLAAYAASQNGGSSGNNSSPGRCDCPEDTAVDGSRCGARSAYSRNGGREPTWCKASY